MPPDIPPNTKGTKYPLITIGAPIAFFWNVEKRHNNNAPQKNEPNTKIVRLFLFDILSLHLVLIPGRAGTLRSLSPLRTGHDSFPSHGSGILKAALTGWPGCHTSYANIARNSRADNAGNNLLFLLFLRCQKYLANSGG